MKFTTGDLVLYRDEEWYVSELVWNRRISRDDPQFSQSIMLIKLNEQNRIIGQRYAVRNTEIEKLIKREDNCGTEKVP